MPVLCYGENEAGEGGMSKHTDIVRLEPLMRPLVEPFTKLYDAIVLLSQIAPKIDGGFFVSEGNMKHIKRYLQACADALEEQG